MDTLYSKSLNYVEESLKNVLKSTKISNQIKPVYISVVIPVYNEEKNLEELRHRLVDTLNQLFKNYEIIFINDGSSDNTLGILRRFRKQNPSINIISLARNFGHQKALTAGLEYARGRIIVIMDADLQDPPEVIPEFIKKWQEGYQVVYAVREKRKENFFKRCAYFVFYRILHAIASIDIPLDSGDFCLLDRKVSDSLNALPERTRFIRGLRSWVGFRQIGINYERAARYAGASNYNFAKLLKLALDGLISFSEIPLRISVYLGLGIAGLSFILGFYYLFKSLLMHMGPAGFPTTVILILFLGSIQLITIGIASEYIGHILVEVKQRPVCIIDEVIGFGQEDCEDSNETDGPAEFILK